MSCSRGCPAQDQVWDASEVTTLQGRACRGPSLALCSSSHCWYPGDTGNTAEGWRKTGGQDGTGKVLGEQEVEGPCHLVVWVREEGRGSSPEDVGVLQRERGHENSSKQSWVSSDLCAAASGLGELVS